MIFPGKGKLGRPKGWVTSGFWPLFYNFIIKKKSTLLFCGKDHYSSQFPFSSSISLTNSSKSHSFIHFCGYVDYRYVPSIPQSEDIRSAGRGWRWCYRWSSCPFCVHPSYCGDADRELMTEQQGRKSTDANDVIQANQEWLGQCGYLCSWEKS